MKVRAGGILSIGAILIGTLAMAACSGSSTSSPTASSTAPTGSATPAATTTAPATTQPNGGGDVIEVVMTDNVFDPVALTIPVGKAVTIRAKNTGTAIHNMHVMSAAAEGKDFTSALIVNPGEESEFEVMFTKAGAIPFQCDFHLPAMAGTITAQ